MHQFPVHQLLFQAAGLRGVDAQLLQHAAQLLHRRAHAEAQVRVAVALHAGDHLVEHFGVLVGIRQQRRVLEARIQLRPGLEHVVQRVVLVEDAALDVDPVQRALVAQALHLLAGEALVARLQALQQVLLGQRVGAGDLVQDLLFELQALAEAVGRLGAGDARVDHAAGAGQVAAQHQALDVLGQGIGDVVQIRHHGIPLPSIFPNSA